MYEVVNCARCRKSISTDPKLLQRRPINMQWLIDYFRALNGDQMKDKYTCCSCNRALYTLRKRGKLEENIKKIQEERKSEKEKKANIKNEVPKKSSKTMKSIACQTDKDFEMKRAEEPLTTKQIAEIMISLANRNKYIANNFYLEF